MVQELGRDEFAMPIGITNGCSAPASQPKHPPRSATRRVPRCSMRRWRRMRGATPSAMPRAASAPWTATLGCLPPRSTGRCRGPPPGGCGRDQRAHGRAALGGPQPARPWGDPATAGRPGDLERAADLDGLSLGGRHGHGDGRPRRSHPQWKLAFDGGARLGGRDLSAGGELDAALRGEAVRMRDAKGLGYLARLWSGRAPRSMRATSSGGLGPIPTPTGSLAELSVAGESGAGALLDDEARLPTASELRSCGPRSPRPRSGTTPSALRGPAGARFAGGGDRLGRGPGRPDRQAASAWERARSA